jgi:hypothetical protein
MVLNLNDPKMIAFHARRGARHVEDELQKSSWIFEIVRSYRWDLTFGKFEDGSAYWLHVGPVSFTFGFKGAKPVEPFNAIVAFAAIKTWFLGHVTRLAGRR